MAVKSAFCRKLLRTLQAQVHVLTEAFLCSPILALLSDLLHLSPLLTSFRLHWVGSLPSPRIHKTCSTLNIFPCVSSQISSSHPPSLCSNAISSFKPSLIALFKIATYLTPPRNPFPALFIHIALSTF